MKDEDFDQFVDDCRDSLDRKQDVLQHDYGFGTHAEYRLDLEKGTLVFLDSTGASSYIASIVPIGTYSPASNIWMWAWANESLPDDQRSAARSLSDLAALTGMTVFESPTIQADEDMPWELSAMAVHQLGSMGCYHVTAGSLLVFVAIQEVSPG